MWRVAIAQQHVESLRSEQILQGLCEFSNHHFNPDMYLLRWPVCFGCAIMHTEVMPQPSQRWWCCSVDACEARGLELFPLCVKTLHFT
jgi:hypothetical protein